ncbi:glucose-1-phosphate adenylyltransferase [Candidatus Nitrosoglobus terrae]|uniref:Glucose-1-phosphate adenylyltransferase n=1 Tax=Candidatus Nitrosoglobus terrae TaxID=1630141 RepID=A0A1Q2SNV1_9GAMM|nr:glucose-1-phosphate adenylyltransferase [Candidatus Nitrosoglobus terrae]BAW80777.1 glucose-1-phosphate adenylyltransferase [Candidatus Nitrosoglobus terrae]
MVKNYSERFVSRLTHDTLALVLAGGRGSRLKQLTAWRAKPAVPIGGKFRIIDFPLSNCVNSGVRRIGVLTQYKAHSLIRHIQQGWGFMRGHLGEFVELLPASQRIEDAWYAGTADAVYQNLDIIRSHRPKYVLILAGDHVYKMDYGDMLAYHVECEADLTVGCIHVPLKEAKAFGVMSVDEDFRVTAFNEKPDQPQPSPGRVNETLASMGIYVFNADFLYEQLIKNADISNTSHDFGKDIIPSILRKNYRAIAFPFRDAQGGDPGYWRDVGTVDAFWKTNIELIDVNPELNLYDDDWPIWTYQPGQLPPAKFIFDNEDRRGMAVDSMVSGGCIISGAGVRHSLLFSDVRVHSYTEMVDSIVLPNVVIGKHCYIKGAILDKGCVIPDGMIIGEDLGEDKKRFHVTEEEGIVLVTPEMLGQKYRYIR